MMKIKKNQFKKESKKTSRINPCKLIKPVTWIMRMILLLEKQIKEYKG